MRRVLELGSMVVAPAPAWAHAGHVHWWDIAATWTFDPLVILPLAISGLLYVLGAARLWRRAGPGRGVRPWQAFSFALGWLLLAGALVSPLHWLGERLFTAHMIEHEILMTLAAPLIVLARPGGPALWALPSGWRRALGGLGRWRPLAGLWRVLVRPSVATCLHAVALWAWHGPGLYQAALADLRLHWLQHVSFLATALLFWHALIFGPARRRGYGAAVLYLLATALHSSLLGILLALAPHQVFPLQTANAPAWGLAPLEDQQLAGLIMGVPVGLVYALAALALAGAWMSQAGAPEAKSPSLRSLAAGPLTPPDRALPTWDPTSCRDQSPPPAP